MKRLGLIATVLAFALSGGAAWQIAGLWSARGGISMPAGGGQPAERKSAAQPNAAYAADIITPRTENDAQPAPPPAPAQQPPASNAPPAPPPAPGGAAPGKPVVDETALRYFARQGDTRRLNTEIARLRSLYPDWVPPDDPLKGPQIADPQLDALWQLYSQGQFAAARAAITARQAKEPGWTPPKDLLDRLSIAETRERLINTSNAKQYMKVIELATTTPSLLTCGDIDVLWRLAEAFAQTDRTGRSQDAYRYILTTCTDPHDRLSTMQKAMALLPRADLEPLFALGHPGTDGDEFRSIREELARSTVAAGAADAKTIAEAADLKLLQDAASAGNSAADALLLGSYFRQHDDPVQAEHWYRLAYIRQNDAASAEGLGLALISLKRSAEAEAILAPWHDANDGARKSYTAAVANLLAQQPPQVLAADVLARLVAAVAAQRDAAAAQQLGWYSHFYRQDETAARWFAAALSWKPDDEPSAYGLAVVNQAMNRRDALRTIVGAWGARSLRIRALADPAAARELAQRGSTEPQMPQPLQAPVAPAPAAQAAPPPAAAVEPMAMAAPEPQSAPPVAREPNRRQQRRAAPAAPSSARQGGCAGGVAAGWCLMKLDRPLEAVTAFRNALSSGSARDRQDAAYGLSLAYLRLGLTAQAAAASTQAPLPSGRARELTLAILNQRIIADYQAGRYAEALTGLDTRAGLVPEQTDLLMVRGWSYFHLQRFTEARRVFEAVAATGNSAAAAAVVAVQEATHTRY